MINEETRDLYDRVRAKALHDGIDLLEAMDRAGMIVTPAQINLQWANALERLWMNIESQPVTALVQLGGGQNTPRDAVKGVLEYMDFFQKQFLRLSRGEQ